MKHQTVFLVCIFLIFGGLAIYLAGFFSICYGSSEIFWVYLSILGLDAWFIGVVTICVAEYRRKPKSLLIQAVVLLATDGLLYLLASWIISPYWSPFNWSIFNYDPLSVPLIVLSLNEGSWVVGFGFLYLGIVATSVGGFCMILLGVVLAVKEWIEKLAHVNGVKVTVNVPPPSASSVMRKKYCRYCGAENKSEAVYCEKCGKNIT